MATLDSLVADTREMLYGIEQAARPAEDTLSQNETSATEIRLSTPSMWKRGDYAEVADTVGEIVLLTEDHPAAADVTVRRVQRGSATSGALTSGEVVYKNPVFTRTQTVRYITEAVESDLSPYVWTAVSRSLAWADGDTYYPLAATDGDVVEVYQYDVNSDGKLHVIDPANYEVVWSVDTGAVATGRMLRIVRPFDVDSTVYYTAKVLPTVANIAEMSNEVARMVPWAAAAKLLAGGRTVPESTDKRRVVATDQKSALRNDYASLMSEFLRMRNQESVRLRLRYPERPRFRPRARRSW
jgi:hypothetical protein